MDATATASSLSLLLRQTAIALVVLGVGVLVLLIAWRRRSDGESGAGPRSARRAAVLLLVILGAAIAALGTLIVVISPGRPVQSIVTIAEAPGARASTARTRLLCGADEIGMLPAGVVIRDGDDTLRMPRESSGAELIAALREPLSLPPGTVEQGRFPAGSATHQSVAGHEMRVDLERWELRHPDGALQSVLLAWVESSADVELPALLALRFDCAGRPVVAHVPRVDLHLLKEFRFPYVMGSRLTQFFDVEVTLTGAPEGENWIAPVHAAESSSGERAAPSTRAPTERGG